MRRWGFVAAVIICTLLAIFVSMLWLRGGWHSDTVEYLTTHHLSIGICNSSKGIAFGYRGADPDDARQANGFYQQGYDDDSSPSGSYGSGPFIYGVGNSGPNGMSSSVGTWPTGGGGLFGGGGYTYGADWMNTSRPAKTYAGFGAAANDQLDFAGTVVYTAHIIVLPHWFFLLLFLLPFARSIFLINAKRRLRKRSLCLGCGYDLRYSNERCPECGRAVESKEQLQLAKTRGRMTRKRVIKIVGLVSAGIGLCIVIFIELNRRQSFDLQDQCMDYTIDPNTVIYGYQTFSLDDPYPIHRSAPLYWSKLQVILKPVLPERSFLNHRTDGHFSLLARGPVFMHRMQSGGLTRLVVVHVANIERTDVFWARVIEPASLMNDAAIDFQNSVNLGDENDIGIKIMAGQIDPKDASHFTIAFEKAGLISDVAEGWLEKDGSLRWSVHPAN